MKANLLVMNKANYDRQTPQVQQGIRRAATRAIDFQLDYIQQAWADSMRQIRDRGVTVTELTPAQLADFQSRIKHLTDQWDAELGRGIVQMVRNAR